MRNTEQQRLPFLLADMPPEASISLPSKTVTIWTAIETLLLADITRAEKLGEPQGFTGTFTPRQTAGVAAFSIIIRQLEFSLDEYQAYHFMPPFLTINGKRWDFDDIVEEGDYVDNFESSLSYQPCTKLKKEILTQKLREHNEHRRRLTQKDPALTDYLMSEYCVADGDTPFMWAPCSGIVRWLETAEREKWFEWQELKKVPPALALVCAWREYFRELGFAEMRAMFLAYA